ncbi:MAG: organomercurial lyase [Acidimicrobiales bacterium]
MEPDLEQIAQAFIDGYPEFSADEQRLVRSVYELLATGRPASPQAVAEAAGWAPDEVKRQLDTWGAVFRDRHGDVVGFYGFAIEELTGHRIDLGAIGSGWTWCAYDTLFIPHLLDVTATVQSPCPTTGEPVQLQVSRVGVTDLHPAEAVVSLLTPDGPFDDQVRQTLCHYIHFFSSPAAADSWIDDHPRTYQISMADAFENARRQNAAVYPALIGADQTA